MIYLGSPETVGDRYLEINFGRDPQAAGTAGGRSGDGEARVLELWVEDQHGERSLAVPQGQRMTLRVRVLFMVDVEDPQASVYIHNDEHQAVMVASTGLELERSGQFAAGEEALFSFSFDNVLAPGRYSPVVNLAHRGSGLDVIDRYESEFSFIVSATRALGGLVDVPITVEVSHQQPMVTGGPAT
jgi:hypothetical protein